MRILLKIYFMIDPQYRDIIVKGTGVEFGVHVNICNVTFYVRKEFNVVVHVPFSESYAKISCCVGFHTVCCGENVSRRNESTAAHVHAFRWILFQYRHLPGIFAY